MPLVTGRDRFGRPLYAGAPGAVPDYDTTKNGTTDPAATQQQPFQTQPQESNIDYSLINDRQQKIKQQGSNATYRAQQSAQEALAARLNRMAQQGQALSNQAMQFKGNIDTTDIRGRLISQVASQKGVMYKWGGESPKTGFDCSGLVQWAYGRLGISMPRTSGPQAHMGVRMPIRSLSPGDLVAHPGHIAVYAGNGMMWEAPHTGAAVRLVPVRSDMYGVHLNLPGD